MTLQHWASTCVWFHIANIAITPAAPTNSPSTATVNNGTPAAPDADVDLAGEEVVVEVRTSEAAPRTVEAVLVSVLSTASRVVSKPVVPEVPTMRVFGRVVVMVRLPLVKVETRAVFTKVSEGPMGVATGMKVGITGPGSKGTAAARVSFVSSNFYGDQGMRPYHWRKRPSQS